MSSHPDIKDQITSQYPHRTPEDTKDSFNAEKILENYIEYESVQDYSSIDSEFPYHAALGWNSGLDGEVMISSHYTFPTETGYNSASATTGIHVEETDQAIEDIIGSENVIDAAGAEIESAKETLTPEGDTINVNSVHCIVFYDEPVLNRKLVKQEKFQDQAHRKSAMDALNEPSVATAMITSGKEKSGVQIDYWTRSFDGIDNGLNYDELNWDNPGET